MAIMAERSGDTRAAAECIYVYKQDVIGGYPSLIQSSKLNARVVL